MDNGLIATLIFAAVLSAILTVSLDLGQASARYPLTRALVWVETYLAIFLTVSILIAALLQVATRHYFSAAFDFSWTEELSRLLLVWMTYWGAAAVQRRKEHIDVSVLYDLAPPFLRRVLSVAVDVIVLGILAIVTVTGLQSAWLQMGQATITLGVPVFVFAVAVPIGCGLMFAHTAADALRVLAGRRQAD